MRITHINSYDVTGGAARAAYRLHIGLRFLGHESRMLVQQKDSDDSSVIRFEPPLDVPTRFRRVLMRRILTRSRKPISSRPVGSTYMSDDRSEQGADLLRQLPPSDILHLHWVAGFIDYADFFRCLPRSLPIIWTLHDMNPFTGGCHFDAGCGKYRDRCGACPQMGSSHMHDFSARSWERKNEAFASRGSNAMHLVVPSRWLAEEAKKSSLLGRLPMTVIPWGLDTERFQPRDRQFARQLFGIPPQAKVVLFIADWAGEKRKGLDLLLEAFKGLEDLPELYVFAVGRGVALKELGKRALAINYVRDDITLSLVYSAADLFVMPALQDNLPLTALEALSCGVPTVGFAVGGLLDIVREGQTGSLVPPGDVRALRNAIAELLQNPERRASMAEESRRIAVKEYRLDVPARRYEALYESFIQGQGRS